MLNTSECCHYLWVVAYKDPEEKKHDWRYGRIHPYIEDKELETAINEATAVFAQDAVIKTLERPRFNHVDSCRTREYPVPEGVLHYYRREFRRRRQKFIEEID